MRTRTPQRPLLWSPCPLKSNKIWLGCGQKGSTKDELIWRELAGIHASSGTHCYVAFLTTNGTCSERSHKNSFNLIRMRLVFLVQFGCWLPVASRCERISAQSPTTFSIHTISANESAGTPPVFAVAMRASSRSSSLVHTSATSSTRDSRSTQESWQLCMAACPTLDFSHS